MISFVPLDLMEKDSENAGLLAQIGHEL